MSEKRELVFKAFNNEKTDRVPVGFWFHYTPDELLSAYDHPEYPELNLKGHKNFVKSFKPDFVKLMSDGYFFEPETAKIIGKAKKAADLRKLEPIAANDKWIKDQVSLVKKLTTSFGKEVATFYNIFAPATAFKWAAGGDKKLATFIKEDKEAVIYALSVIAHNTSILAGEVIKSGKADGIYLSVQSIQDIIQRLLLLLSLQFLQLQMPQAEQTFFTSVVMKVQRIIFHFSKIILPRLLILLRL